MGPHGNLLAGDLAEEAVHNTSARLVGRGNVMVARFDARQIPCADASADLVVAGMLLMLLEQPVNALDEIRRVLRRGGRLGASVWATAKDNPWLTLIGATLARLDWRALAATGVRSGGPFALGSPDSLQHLMIGAGFVDVDIQRVEAVLRCADHRAYLESLRVVLPSVASAIDHADARQYRRLVDMLEVSTREFVQGDVLRLPVSALVCTGSVG